MGDTLRIQPYGGPWQTIGRNILQGTEVEGLVATFDDGGPSTLSCTLPGVDARMPALEVAAFTPIELVGDSGNDPAWGGYLIDTPAGPGGLALSALGWQNALDNGTHPLFYVYEGLDGFVDWRSIRSITAPGFSNNGIAAGEIIQGGDKLRLMWPNGTVVANQSFVAATLDLGPGNTASKMAVTAAFSNNVTWKFYVFGHETPDWRDGYDRENVVNGFQINNASVSPAGTPYQFYRASTPHRYWTVAMYADSSTTAGADVWTDILHFQLFADGAYGEAIADATTNIPRSRSILTASMLMQTELGQTPQLSRDYSRITPTSFYIRSLGGPGEEATQRDVLDRANSYHRYRRGVDASRRGFFLPQPATPTLKVNTADDGVDYNDTSTSSGRDIYNKVIVTGNAGSGTPLRTVKHTEPAVGQSTQADVPQHANPSATVNTTGWTHTILAGTGTAALVRDTLNTRSSPGSFQSQQTGAGGFRARIVGAVTGALPVGARLRLSLWLASTYGWNPSYGSKYAYAILTVRSTPSGTVWVSDKVYDDGVGLFNAGGYTKRFLDFFTTEAIAADTGYEIQIDWFNTYIGDLYFDDVVMERVVVTQPDRRGFPRSRTLVVQAPTDPATMELLADLSLASSARPPFKGSLVVTGNVIYDEINGRHLTPLEAAARTGELIDLTDVLDPITGQTGRIAQIATGTYNNGQATLALDEDRSRYEALMARMAVVQGR